MPVGSFALAVQRMSVPDAALVLSHVASWRGDARWFSTSEVRSLYADLRLPEPANVSATLARLRDRRPPLLRGKPGGTSGWTTTPEGELRADEIIGEFDYGTIAAELQAVPGAFFADAEYPTLPHTFAPPSWAPGIKTFLDRNPFDQNVFLMTRFPKDEAAEPDPLGPVIETLRDAVAKRGLTLHVAMDQQIVDDLWGNVGAHMWASRYGIGVLETRAPQPRDEDEDAGDPTLNDNVLIELGSMLTIGRRCMILRDYQAPMPPTDLTSHIFKTVDLESLHSVAEQTDQWIAKDLRLG